MTEKKRQRIEEYVYVLCTHESGNTSYLIPVSFIENLPYNVLEIMRSQTGMTSEECASGEERERYDYICYLFGELEKGDFDEKEVCMTNEASDELYNCFSKFKLIHDILFKLSKDISYLFVRDLHSI